VDGARPVAICAATARQLAVPAGRHSWSLSAVDRVGNISGVATLVVVRATAVKTPTVQAPASARTVAPQLLRGTVGPG
jgi:hypothetical protein